MAERELLTVLERIAEGVDEQSTIQRESQDDYRAEQARRRKQEAADLRQRQQDNAEARRIMRDKEARDIEAHAAQMEQHKARMEEYELTAQALGLRLAAPDYLPADITRKETS